MPMVMEKPVTAFLLTDPGQVRDHNEDYIASLEPETASQLQDNGLLYILADGAGGMDAGEVASQQSTKWTLDHYRHNGHEVDKGVRLYNAMCDANEKLRRLMLDKGAEGRMATTMVATVIEGNKATIANVGDSRGYHFRDGELRQVTRDHSLVAELVERGVISPEEAENHPRKNVILASLGSDSVPRIELFELELEPGDLLLLCSDGLNSHVRDNDIREILTTYGPADAATKLVALANQRGGTDNISVILIVVDGLGEMPTVLTPRATTAAPRQRELADADTVSKRDGRILWAYTGLLCLVQVVLTFAAWAWLVGEL